MEGREGGREGGGGGMRQSSASTLLENLQARLKQREGEVVQLQVRGGGDGGEGGGEGWREGGEGA